MAQLPGAHFHLETGAFFPPSHQASASPSLFSAPSLPESKPPGGYLGLYDGVDDTLLRACEPWSAGASSHREILEAPPLLDSTKNDLQMGRSAVTNHLHGSPRQEQDWSPFGFTQPFPPVDTAQRLDLGNKAHQFPNIASPLGSLNSFGPEPLGTYNGSFRMPDGYSLATTQQQAAIAASVLSMNLHPHGIDPGLLQIDTQLSAADTAEAPISPLRSSRNSCDSGNEYEGTPTRTNTTTATATATVTTNAIATTRGRRRKSEGDADGAPESPGSGGREKRSNPGCADRRRRPRWSDGSDLKRYEREAEARNVEEKGETVDGGLGPMKGDKKTKRRMQNRLAQRAFRAKSKVQHHEVSEHLKHLEALSESQGDRISNLSALADRLQRENAALKQNS